MPAELNIKKIAMIGCGSMGGGMAQLFAENGIHVSLEDPSSDQMEIVIDSAKQAGIPADRFSKHSDYQSLCESLDKPKVLFFSLPHGSVGDSVLGGLMPYLEKGDIIVDCGNEHWENTERRQGKCVTKGIRYVGCGVSGGYQAARRGPSMCPGADDETLSLVLPLLRIAAAKDPQGKPCVGPVGTGGAGHYCKMIHNGIEHGMMSAIAEAHGLMRTGLGMSLDEISGVFDDWNSKGELQGTFLIWISRDICRTKDEKGQYVLDTVEDKVVQDYTGEEGTGVWSNTEAVEHHVPAPTLTAAHYLRVASGDRHQRALIQKTFGVGSGSSRNDHTSVFPPQRLNSVHDHAAFLETLRMALYTACLAAYCQGLIIIDKADKGKSERPARRSKLVLIVWQYVSSLRRSGILKLVQGLKPLANHFNVNYAELLQVWRAGCIIQADSISGNLLQPMYKNGNATNPLLNNSIAEDLNRGFPHLRTVVAKAVEGDHVVPALSATLEYLKYQTSTALPTNFYEAQLDYFGKHMYDVKGEDEAGQPETGKAHWEWKPA
ncbi:hypothetical protein LTR56_015181 [Elasticomyces elasticus]|nr:hypothetical protein LTR56_015181 [Elasticomyces elasticus]KAK3644475.1 hypothetical protein LTR22_015195 [Elasticomyces elasticus]KAK4915512.1 hypothetical protein LTR49_016359 [Elasticomyces elasticus]KAK5756229.1 hypothetical protein LTS12_013653 [Elasticomyces elasticus]